MKRSAAQVADEEVYTRIDEQDPRTFVFRMGKVGSSVKALIEDVKAVMEPNTASRLQTKHGNTMKGTPKPSIVALLLFSHLSFLSLARLSQCRRASGHLSFPRLFSD